MFIIVDLQTFHTSFVLMFIIYLIKNLVFVDPAVKTGRSVFWCVLFSFVHCCEYLCFPNIYDFCMLPT